MDNAAETPSLLETARVLLAAMERETALARTGALPQLGAASAAKQAAFAAFSAACALRRGSAAGSDAEREALRRLAEAADANALVIDAVRLTLQDFAVRLRAALAAAIDPGTYGPTGGRVHRAPAARFEASI